METIDIKEKLDEFHEHLKQNPRTILSARFGDGKTFFLNEYFAKHQIWKDYIAIDERVESTEDSYFVVLHPVNYSVAKNEDIFEYIKRDILIQLYQDGKIDDVDYKAVFQAIKEELKGKALPMLGDLASLIPGGKIAKSIIELGVDIKKAYDEEKHTAADFIETFVSQRGGIYEDDAYTQMIRKTLEHLKEPPEGFPARKILVIEDLDRLDPGHLFRILNVLGAHIDDNKETNKFGFDNIIIVLDYDMTEYIFKHFYGRNANYSGYMHKFISSHVYRFSIQEIAQQQFMRFLLESCHVSDEILDTILYEVKDDEGEIIEHTTIKSYISQMSVRDVARVLDNVGNNIINSPVHFESGKIVEAQNNVTLFLSALMHMNVKYDVKNFIGGLPCTKDTLEFLGDFLLATPDLHRTAIRTENGLIGIRTKRRSSFDRAELFETAETAPVYVSTREVVYNAFKVALSCVSECPKIQHKSFSKKDIKDEATYMEHIKQFSDFDKAIGEIEEEV